MAFLTKEQVKSVVQNAPDKSAVINDLIKRGHTLEGYDKFAPQENTKTPQKGENLVTSVFRGITQPVATLIARPFQAAARLAGASEEDVDKVSSQVPFYGSDNRLATPKTGKDVLKDVGRGIETVSLGLGGGEVANLAKQGIKQSVFGLAKREAVQGAKIGATAGFGSGLEQDADLGSAVKGGVTGGVVGATTGAAIPLVFGGVRKAVQTAASPFEKRAAQKLEQTSLLEKGVTDSRVASKSLEGGKLVTDIHAKEAIRQGIPEADVALIKGGSEIDKTKMAKMLDIRQSQLTNKRITDRATDVVGDTFVSNIAKPIENLNRKSGQQLDLVAQGLAGKRINPTSAVTQFADDLEKSGVGVISNRKLDFKGSNFEGLKGVQSLINNVWGRAMRVAKSGDALQAHRLKAYIDEIVNYGKQAEGLSGKAQNLLKSLRHNIDGVLDSTFPAYNKVNTVFSDTINELNKMSVAMGRKFKLGDTFADAQSGLAMRRILSNTKSRADILKLLDSMQAVAKKYGIKIDDDIITQANFADLLEKMLGSEAPTSLLGQTERAVEGLGGAGSEFAKGNVVKGTIKAGKYAFDVTRGINEENKINALRALLRKRGTNFGRSQ